MTDQLPLPGTTPEQTNETQSSSQTPLDAPVAGNAPGLSEQREAIEEASADAASVAQSVAKVNLEFPEIGFINPVEELEKCRQISTTMDEATKRAYPEMVRAKLLAHEADKTKNPPVTDEELAMALYLRRVTDTALTEADIEAKSTGKAKKDPNAPKAPRATKAKKVADDIFKDLGLPGA